MRNSYVADPSASASGSESDEDMESDDDDEAISSVQDGAAKAGQPGSTAGAKGKSKSKIKAEEGQTAGGKAAKAKATRGSRSVPELPLTSLDPRPESGLPCAA